MIRNSLYWRLLAGASAAILVALVVAWIFMTLLFEWHMERRIKSEMIHDGERLVAGLVVGQGGELHVNQPPVESRLMTPAGGYYWEVVGPSKTLRSRSLWAADLSRGADVPTSHWRMRLARGPFEDLVFVLERRIDLPSMEHLVLVQLAQDTKPLERERAEFGHELAAFLGVLWVVLALAAWLQVRLGLRPLGRIQHDLPALQKNSRARLPSASLREVKPLTDAINSLADARERDLAQARRRAADLAHGLRTPLAALAARSRSARRSGAGGMADDLDRAIAAMRRAVEAELARARVAGAGRQTSGSVNLEETVERVVGVLEQTDQGGLLAFSVDMPAGLRLALKIDDLYEMLGAVLENAVRFARRRVVIGARVQGEHVFLAVEDDGPGMTGMSTEEALLRGGRLDETGSGGGLGLAIVKQLLDATGGEIHMSRSSLGGLKVRLEWHGVVVDPRQ